MTKEETEQKNDFEKLWKQVYEEKLQAETKLELLRRAFLDLLDTYHIAIHNQLPSRHQGKREDCMEQSCLFARLMLRKIIDGD